jgi:pyruvate/2-oxoglutarate dehydrogenase complex dihydrolipoamide acyltransferase (E2) component
VRLRLTCHTHTLLFTFVRSPQPITAALPASANLLNMAAPATANQSRDRGIDLATTQTQIARGGHVERQRYRRNTVRASVSCEFRSEKQCFCDRVAYA